MVACPPVKFWCHYYYFNRKGMFFQVPPKKSQTSGGPSCRDEVRLVGTGERETPRFFGDVGCRGAKKPIPEVAGAPGAEAAGLRSDARFTGLKGTGRAGRAGRGAPRLKPSAKHTKPPQGGWERHMCGGGAALLRQRRGAATQTNDSTFAAL